MEKLIELLCEYEDVYNWFATYTIGGEKTKRELKSDYMLDESQDIIQIYVISKQYGFIKWLVENDKIDRDEIIVNSDFMPIAFDRKGEKYEWDEEKQLLMLLSISDTPIEDLISYLK